MIDYFTRPYIFDEDTPTDYFFNLPFINDPNPPRVIHLDNDDYVITLDECFVLYNG